MIRTLRLLSFLWLIAATIAPAWADDAPLEIPGAQTVSAEQVVELVTHRPDLVILDNRHAEDFAAGAIEGARRLLDTEVDAASLAAVLPSKTTPVLFYCNGLKCGRAAKAVQRAVDLGYTEVYYYARGMQEWRALGLPLITKG